MWRWGLNHSDSRPCCVPRDPGGAVRLVDGRSVLSQCYHSGLLWCLDIMVAWQAGRKYEPRQTNKAQRFARESCVSVTPKEVVQVLSNLCVVEVPPFFKLLRKP